MVTRAQKIVGLVGAVAAAWALTACGQSASDAEEARLENAPASEVSSAAPTTEALATTPSTATTSPNLSVDGTRATGMGTASTGDTVSYTVTFGTPIVASSINDLALNSCYDGIESAGSTTDRTVAVPIDVSTTVTSSLPVRVVLDLGSPYTADAEVGLTGITPYLWAKTYSDGPTCESPRNDAGAGGLTWPSLVPGQTELSHLWLVLPGAVTPKDPTGLHGEVATLSLTPLLAIAQESVNVSYSRSSSAKVECNGKPVEFASPTISVDPDAVGSAIC